MMAVKSWYQNCSSIMLNRHTRIPIKQTLRKKEVGSVGSHQVEDGWSAEGTNK